MSRIWRDGKVLWEKEFVSGEDNMSHYIKNLEHHHFKYKQFCKPGDLHVSSLAILQSTPDTNVYVLLIDPN